MTTKEECARCSHHHHSPPFTPSFTIIPQLSHSLILFKMFASASSQSLLRFHSLHSTHPMPHSLTLSRFPAATSSSFHRHHYAVQPLTLRSVTRRFKPAIITACDRSNQVLSSHRLCSQLTKQKWTKMLIWTCISSQV